MAQACPRCQTELVAGARFCHQCGRRLEIGAGNLRARMLRIAMVAAAIDGVVAWLLLFVVVENVLFTGPILFALGIALIVGSWPIRFWWGGMLGAMHCGICALLVMLVNLLRLSPGTAKAPSIVMGAVYLVSALPLAAFAYCNIPAEHDPSRCVKCGYLLYGLSEPRCPECGTAFDLSAVGEPPTPY